MSTHKPCHLALRIPTVFVLCLATALLSLVAAARAQSNPAARTRATIAPLVQREAPTPPAQPAPAQIVARMTLADIGFAEGIRFANLGGRREIFVPVPQGGEVRPQKLSLLLDDISAHAAKRSVDILVNDRSVLAISLDGKSRARVVDVPLTSVGEKDGFVKIAFVYSGAATPDRCIDVRYVGDSLTILPQSAIDLALATTSRLDVATIAALMPRTVSIVLPDRTLSPSDLTTALTVARALAASGRHADFVRGLGSVTKKADAQNPLLWSHGIIAIGSLDQITERLDAPGLKIAGPLPDLGMIAAVRIQGEPALLIANAAATRVGQLLASPSLAATRGVTAASVGQVLQPNLPSDRVTFDQLGLATVQADVFGRADLKLTVDTRRLPAGKKAKRLLLDVMVAPDSGNQRAVVSVYVNDTLLGSSVAAIGEPTRFDLDLPPGLVGIAANIRAVVQRPSAQGDCRFEPQGYPAQILGSSAIVLVPADAEPQDFSAIAPFWANGIDVLLPANAAEQPTAYLGLAADTLNALAPEHAPIRVKLFTAGVAPLTANPFLAVSASPPQGSRPRVGFDRGRVAVTDRAGRTLLDLGGFTQGAVAQVVSVNGTPGVWIKAVADANTLPTPPDLHLDHGDVAFIDRTGVALAMSTTRDTLVRISYPDQTSWTEVAQRFRSWIVGGLWLLATVTFLLVLQRILRRRPEASSE